MKHTKIIASLMIVALAMSQPAFAAETKQAPAKQTTGKQEPAKATQKEQSKKPAQPVVHTLEELKPIKILNKSNVKLNEANILTQDQGNILTYTVTFQNNDAKTINLADYWTKVKSKSGDVFSVKIISNDKDKKQVPPQSSQTLTFYAEIGNHSKTNDLIFEVVKWDFSKPDYENIIGKFTIPANYTTSTPVKKTKILQMNDIKLNTKIEQMVVFPTDEYNYINVGLGLENIGSKVLDDPKFKFVIKTASGANFPLVPDASSVDYKIQPKDKKTLNLMTMIPIKEKIDKLEMQILQDDEAAKISLPRTTFEMPKPSSKEYIIAEDQRKIIPVNNTNISTRIVSSWYTESFNNKDIAITFEFENVGKQSVVLPKYDFVLQGSNGFTFPISTKALENVTVKPQAKHTVKLNVTLPEDTSTEHLELHMNYPQAQDTKESSPKDIKFSYPAGIYGISKLMSVDNGLGVEYQVNNNKGSFGVKLSSIQRLPWSDGDLISARMTIKNRENKSIELPKLEGVFKIDSAQNSGETKLVQGRNSLILGPNDSVDVYVVAKVPSFIDYNQVQIALMEKIGEDSTELIKFTNNGGIVGLNTVKFGSTYNLETQGRRAEVSARKTLSYPSASVNLISTDLIMKNLETRQADLSQIVGYYKSKDGQFFKASIVQVDRPTAPDGKNIITAWAKIPKNIDTSEMQLIVGEGIADNKMTPPKGESTGYINAVAMELDMRSLEAKSSLKEVEMFPYSLAISNFNAYLTGGSSLRVEFNYDLKRDLSYEMGQYDHKLIMEIADASGRKFDRELTLETDLKLGLYQSHSLSFDNSFFEDIRDGYIQVSLYDQFQGQRLKLANLSTIYNIRKLNRD